MNNTDAAPGITAAPRIHPRGLYTLFFTEMWERFSFYGMRALLVLFMVDQVRGGMGMTEEVAMAIYGLYTAAVYLVCLPGGWLADRLFGARKAVWYGGIIIAIGHFVLAIPNDRAFYLGLTIVVLGTGLLKPNISTMVGELYPEGGARRDAGFTIFYMGINLGAALGPLLCSYLGENVNWHYGFGAAGVGMVLGSIQYRLTSKHLGTAGLVEKREPMSGGEKTGLLLAGVGLVVTGALCFGGWLKVNPLAVAKGTTAFIVGIAAVYFICLFLSPKLDRVEKKRLAVILMLFLASALFWAGFEQVGSSFNLFADRHTVRVIPGIDRPIPAGWFQSLNPVFIITLAPVIAALWIKLAERGREPSLPVKFAAGLFLVAVGFGVMALAAKFIGGEQKVWPTWLMTTYLLHTIGELCVSPVGLSSVTKLAPRRLVGQMMGLWFLATSLGNLVAGLIAGKFEWDTVERMPEQFLLVAVLPVIVGVVLLVIARPMQRLMAGVK